MYKLYKTSLGQDGVLQRNTDGSVTSFLCEADNTDYQAFLKYQADGGRVYGADEEVPAEENQ
jgi:hypothetical protein